MSQFRNLMVLSVAVAFASALLPFAHEPSRDFAWTVSLGLTIAWLIVVVIAMIKFKKRGLWFLLGAPLALFLPSFLAFLVYACAHHGECL